MTDLKDLDVMRALVEAPALARRLYPRGGYEGLEPNALQLLAAIERAPGSTVTDLASLLALGIGTTSTALTVLRGRGLVDVASDPADQRRRPHALTVEGAALLRRFTAEARRRVRTLS